MKLSIILNTFNSERTIERCLRSIQNQSYGDFECVIVDDCSTDKTKEVCKEYSITDQRFHIISNEINFGCSLSRAIGFNHSSGKYLVFVDSDDWMECDYLKLMLSCAKNNDADLVYCDYFEEDGKSVLYMRQDIDQKANIQIIAAMASYDPFTVSSMWNKLIRRDLISRIVFPKERYGEDMYISLQLAYYSKKSAYVPKSLYHYWVNNHESLCNHEEKEYERRLSHYDICKKILLFLGSHYSDLSQFEPMLSIRMNKTSLRVFEDPILRKQRDAFALYPPSIKFIFRKEVPFGIFTKVIYLLSAVYWRLKNTVKIKTKK